MDWDPSVPIHFGLKPWTSILAVGIYYQLFFVLFVFLFNLEVPTSSTIVPRLVLGFVADENFNSLAWDSLIIAIWSTLRSKKIFFRGKYHLHKVNMWLDITFSNKCSRKLLETCIALLKYRVPGGKERCLEFLMFV